MIGKLTGILDEIAHDHIILMVGGIGYKVYVSINIYKNMSIGGSITMRVEDVVSSDGVRFLYGFEREVDQACFRMLTKVSGVGYKTAMSILSLHKAEKVFSAISLNKPDSIRVSGVGAKVIGRIISDLQGKVPEVNQSDFLDIEDALMALVSLGYEKSKVIGVLNSIVKTEKSSTTGELIRIALRELSP